MKTKLFAVLLIPAAYIWADDKKLTDKKPPANQKSASTRSDAKPSDPKQESKGGAPTIPEGATEIDAYTYRHIDAQGKPWIYRKTPFGVVKFEDKPAADKPTIDMTNPIVITEEGENVKFEWTTPFGRQSWSKKKADLTDDEKATMDREKKKKAALDKSATDQSGKRN